MWGSGEISQAEKTGRAKAWGRNVPGMCQGSEARGSVPGMESMSERGAIGGARDVTAVSALGGGLLQCTPVRVAFV